jgi:hypothetical protein
MVAEEADFVRALEHVRDYLVGARAATQAVATA